MKDKIVEFYDNFNIDDLQGFLGDLDLLALLSHPAAVTVCIVLGLLSIYGKWRFITVTVLSYVFLYGYLFVALVIVKNSDISSGLTFILLFSAFFLIIGLKGYKYLTD